MKGELHNISLVDFVEKCSKEVRLCRYYHDARKGPYVTCRSHFITGKNDNEVMKLENGWSSWKMKERKKSRKAHACDNASSCLLKQWLAIQCYNFYIITFLEHACIFLFFVSACLLKSYKYNIHLWQVDSFFFYCHEKKSTRKKIQGTHGKCKKC